MIVSGSILNDKKSEFVNKYDNPRILSNVYYTSETGIKYISMYLFNRKCLNTLFWEVYLSNCHQIL